MSPRVIYTTLLRGRSAISELQIFLYGAGSSSLDRQDESATHQADVVSCLVYSIIASRNDRLEDGSGEDALRADDLRCVIPGGEFYERNTSRVVIKTSRATTRPESSQHRTFRSPRSRNKPAIIRLGELQLRLARRGLVASCVHWNPLPDYGGKLTPAVKTVSAPRNRTVIPRT